MAGPRIAEAQGGEWVMRKKKIQSVCMLAVVAALLPVAWLLASLRAGVIGNFVVYFDEEKFDRTFEWLWLRPANRIVEWGWDDRQESAYRTEAEPWWAMKEKR